MVFGYCGTSVTARKSKVKKLEFRGFERFGMSSLFLPMCTMFDCLWDLHNNTGALSSANQCLDSAAPKISIYRNGNNRNTWYLADHY